MASELLDKPTFLHHEGVPEVLCEYPRDLEALAQMALIYVIMVLRNIFYHVWNVCDTVGMLFGKFLIIPE